MNASAVADAQLNADLNGVKNCRFICGKAEDVISNLLKEYGIDGLENIDATQTAKASCVYILQPRQPAGQCRGYILRYPFLRIEFE